MKATVKGTILQKNTLDIGEGQDKKTYYSFLLFTGDKENADIKCSKKFFDTIKEGQKLEAEIQVSARLSYGDANLYTKLIESKF